jgi:GDPmannose 4,6-dehydratase
LSDFISEVFNTLGLNWQDYVISDPALCRPTDISISRANPSKAREKLGWTAKTSIQETIKIMVKAMQEKINSN